MEKKIEIIKDINYQHALSGKYDRIHEKIEHKYLELYNTLPGKKKKTFKPIDFKIPFKSGYSIVCKFFSQKLILLTMYNPNNKTISTNEINISDQKEKLVWYLN